MKSFSTIAFSIALCGLTCAALPAAAQSMSPPSPDAKMKMQSCMAMSSDAMMADSGCMAMMKKMHMTPADVKMVQSCKAMPHDAMMADSGCASMMKMHPNVMRATAGAM